MKVCVDASLVLKWLLHEEGSDTALELLDRWKKEGIQLIAPGLIDYEIGSALRKKILRNHLHSDDLLPLFDLYMRTGLLLFHLSDLVAQSVPLAGLLDQPTVYDVAYLLIAKQQKADFVTADEKFCRKAKTLYPFVKYYRDLVERGG